MPSPRWFHPVAGLGLACALGAQTVTPAQGIAAAYHGGALVVTDPDLAQGHLVPGQVLPIRISRLRRPAPGPPALQGFESPGSVRYAQLAFLRVSPASVTFSVAFREGGPGRTITLRQGESVDLDGDGLPDLALRAPVKALMAGPGVVDYALLAFPCDAEHTAMFALAPEAFKDARYPYGISGVTPAGQFIFQSDCLPVPPVHPPGAACLLIPEGAGAALRVRPGPGDVLVETPTGRFGTISGVRPTARGLEIQYAPAATPFLFQEVFGAARVRISGRLGELARRYRCGPSALWEANLMDLALTQHLLDVPGCRLDLQLAARLDVGLTLSASVDAGGVAANLAATLDEDLRLAADCRVEAACSLKLGPFPLARPEVGFAVYGVPMAFGLDLTAGVDLDNQVSGKALEGISVTGRWGWSAGFAASWDWLGIEVQAPAPLLTDTLVVQALPENAFSMDGQSSVRPWLELTPRLTFASMLRAECPNTLAVVGSVSVQGDPPSSHAQLDVNEQLAAGFAFELPVLGQVWERTWPLFAWSGTVWSRDGVLAWGSPSF